ncbi:MAG: molybdopterin dinucleotide binding domain-containing protein, partial [Candidatus Thorarchaeota archaeon]
DPSRCRGCREGELDYCPGGGIVQPSRMPWRDEVRGRRSFVRMHPDTARSLGLSDGDRVTIESRHGVLPDIRLEVTNDIDPRVIWLSDGWWNDDGNVNVLTEDRHTAFGHTPGFNSILVRVRRFEGGSDE